MRPSVSQAEVENLIASLLVVKCMENCQGSTAGSILTALEAAGLEIVRKRSDAGPHQEIDAHGIILEIADRRNVSISALAEAAGIAPSTLNRPLNNPDCTVMINVRNLNKIIAWDNAQEDEA